MTLPLMKRNVSYAVADECIRHKIPAIIAVGNVERTFMAVVVLRRK